MKNKEVRNFGNAEVTENRTVIGYAALYNTESNDLGFIEIIESGAFDGVIENSDVFAYLNHDESRGVLARCKNGVGSLKLSLDEKGLRYEFEAPVTALGDELLEMLKRGDITESSFAFTIDSDKWETRNGKDYRIIKKIKRLYDVSPVYTPAYSGTYVDAAKRSYNAYKAEQLKDYYTNLKSIL